MMQPDLYRSAARLPPYRADRSSKLDAQNGSDEKTYDH